MTDVPSTDWAELRRLATDLAAIEPRFRSSRATLMAHYRDATEPEHILALLDRFHAEEVLARNAMDKAAAAITANLSLRDRAEKAEAEAKALREALRLVGQPRAGRQVEDVLEQLPDHYLIQLHIPAKAVRTARALGGANG